MSELENLGEMLNKDGEVEKIVALFTVYRDDREVTVCETDQGTIVVSTKSWLRQNDRKLVEHVNAYTKETFAMMFEAMVLGSQYLQLDLTKEAMLLHASQENQINYEYAGRGEPNFKRD